MCFVLIFLYFNNSRELACFEISLRLPTLLMKRLWHRYFRVNFVKILRTLLRVPVYCIICVQRIYQKAFLNWLYQNLSFVYIFFNRFCPVWRCWITPHCLNRDSSTLIEHLRTAVFESVTENNLGNSARGENVSSLDEKFHIIYIFSTRAENLRIISPLDVWLGFNCWRHTNIL